MPNKYECVRTCYYLGKLFKPGNPLPDWAEPNKHFLPVGESLGEDEKKKVFGPGDDPRSTRQIKKDLKEKFDIDASGTRKDLWLRWKEATDAAEDAARQDAEASFGAPQGNAKHPERFDRPAFKNESLNKKFTEMSPDDIDKLSVKDMCDKLNAPPYSRQDAKPGPGMTKARLVKMGVDFEEKQTMGL